VDGIANEELEQKEDAVDSEQDLDPATLGKSHNSKEPTNKIWKDREKWW
jgi:hypothetical protein